MAINNFQNILANITDGGSNVLSGVSGKTFMMLGLDICNTYSSGIQVSVSVKRSSSEYFIAKNVVIPAGSTIKILDGQKHIILPTDVLYAIVGTAGGTADLVGSYMEIA